MASHDLINAFDDCVDRLHQGQSVEDCLRVYPQYASVLGPMLETGLAVQRVAPAIPSAARARVRARVMQAAVPIPRRTPPWTSRLTLMAASLVVVLFAVALVSFFNRTNNNHLRTEPIPASETAPFTPGTSPTASLTRTPTTAPTLTAELSPTATMPVTATADPDPTAAPSSTVTPECRFVVTASSANLREGPGTGYPVLRFAYAGDEFVALALHTGDEWIEISTSDGEHWIALSTGELRGDCSTLPESDTLYIAGNEGGAIPSSGDVNTPFPTMAGDDHGLDDHSGSSGSGDDSGDDHSSDDSTDHSED